ncbi:HBR126Cp [Eremothecium sinecaudum]|uniref:HBR126Cp n=1 Tax=Eremothecium sinecaudum TaxID=45286 RepID=A0A109UXM6_9SACH|nr:HBR126Cp [Eremothecium sinecaudum]AMD19027.1 HBR126Cp [Eremothecium sinecaudum]
MGGPGRVLRSNQTPRIPHSNEDDDRFNFDIKEYDINPAEPLKIVYTSTSSIKTDDDEDIKRSREIISHMKLDIRKPLLVATCLKRSKSADSLLDDDDKYDGYHKKMFKQETRMINDDKVESEREAERLQYVNETLDMPGWEQALARATVIHDMSDIEELNRKREQTKRTINDMLGKFKAMKRSISLHMRNHRNMMHSYNSEPSLLYGKVERSLVFGYTSSSDEEEENMNIEQIRQHRRTLRERKIAGSIIIQLSDNTRSYARFAVVAEPLKSAYVIKFTKEEKERYKKTLEESPTNLQYNPPLPDQTARYVRKIKLPLTLEPKPLRNISSVGSDSASRSSNSTIEQIRKFRIKDASSYDNSVLDTNAPCSPVTNNQSPSLETNIPVKRNMSSRSSFSSSSRKRYEVGMEGCATDLFLT